MDDVNTTGRQQRSGTGKARRQRAAGVVAGVACTLLLLHAGGAAALSWGQVQGAPVVGQPLQLSLPLTLAAGEDLDCVRADLLQADAAPERLDSRVETLDSERRLLRLSTRRPVLEPVISIRLAVGCRQPINRSWTLLSEPPTQVRDSVPLAADPPPVLALLPVAPIQPFQPDARRTAVPAPKNVAAPKNGAAPKAVTAPEEIAGPKAVPAPKAVAAPKGVPAQQAAPAPQAVPEQRAVPAVAARPPAAAVLPPPNAVAPASILVVAPVTLEPADAPAVLRASSELSTPDAAGLLPRAQAAAAWKLLNDPQDVQARQTSSATRLRQLDEQSRQQALQLVKLNDERDLLRNVVGGLLALVVLGLALALWSRARAPRRVVRWDVPARIAPVAPAPRPVATVARASKAAGPEVGANAIPAAAAREPREEGDSAFDSAAQALEAGAPDPTRPPARVRAGKAGRQAASAFDDSLFGPGRLPSADELLDVQERANFFVAIGLQDQAIDLLEARLQEHYGSSPFLWLDMLDMCRRLGRRDDYERVRARFHAAFPARLPPFEDSPGQSEGLERYPRALSRITLLWHSRRVLGEIEHALFSDGAEGSVMFDLEASRELLLLYGVASEVADGPPAEAELLAPPSVAAGLQDPEVPQTDRVPLIDLDLPSIAGTGGRGVDVHVDFNLEAMEHRAADLQPAVPDSGSLDLDLSSPAPISLR